MARLLLTDTARRRQLGPDWGIGGLGDSKVHGIHGSLWPIPKRQAMCEGLRGDTSWSGSIVPLAWAQNFVAIADTPSRIDYATPDRVLRAQRSIGRLHTRER